MPRRPRERLPLGQAGLRGVGLGTHILDCVPYPRGMYTCGYMIPANLHQVLLPRPSTPAVEDMVTIVCKSVLHKTVRLVCTHIPKYQTHFESIRPFLKRLRDLCLELLRDCCVHLPLGHRLVSDSAEREVQRRSILLGERCACKQLPVSVRVFPTCAETVPVGGAVKVEAMAASALARDYRGTAVSTCITQKQTAGRRQTLMNATTSWFSRTPCGRHQQCRQVVDYERTPSPAGHTAPRDLSDSPGSKRSSGT